MSDCGNAVVRLAVGVVEEQLRHYRQLLLEPPLEGGRALLRQEVAPGSKEVGLEPIHKPEGHLA